MNKRIKEAIDIINRELASHGVEGRISIKIHRDLSNNPIDATHASYIIKDLIGKAYYDRSPEGYAWVCSRRVGDPQPFEVTAFYEEIPFDGSEADECSDRESVECQSAYSV